MKTFYQFLENNDRDEIYDFGAYAENDFYKFMASKDKLNSLNEYYDLYRFLHASTPEECLIKHIESPYLNFVLPRGSVKKNITLSYFMREVDVEPNNDWYEISYDPNYFILYLKNKQAMVGRVKNPDTKNEKHYDPEFQVRFSKAEARKFIIDHIEPTPLYNSLTKPSFLEFLQTRWQGTTDLKINHTLSKVYRNFASSVAVAGHKSRLASQYEEWFNFLLSQNLDEYYINYLENNKNNTQDTKLSPIGNFFIYMIKSYDEAGEI